jgi:hypothetical protein
VLEALLTPDDPSKIADKLISTNELSLIDELEATEKLEVDDEADSE